VPLQSSACAKVILGASAFIRMCHVQEPFSHPSSQVALAPPGTQACTLDIEKFHRTCTVLPDHKPWLVLQGYKDHFYIDHTHPFGESCASSNAGMIANAMVDIWIGEGVGPILKYEDDLNILRFPVQDGPFKDGQQSYAYD